MIRSIPFPLVDFDQQPNRKVKVGRKHKIAISILAVGVLLLALFWTSGTSYDGKSIKKWFYGSDERNSEAFRAMGQSALPFLIERLEDAPSEGIQVALGLLSSTPKEIYRQRKQMWQDHAAYLLGEMGTAAHSAVPHLTNATNSENWSLRGAATVALIKIREQPIDPLIEKLRDTSDSHAWYQNAMMVGQFGSRAEPAIPLFLNALQYSNEVIQAHALVALGMIASQPDRCIPAILPFATSPNIGFRQKALGTLIAFGSGSFGTNELSTRKAIEVALNDSDRWSRERAALGMKFFQRANR